MGLNNGARICSRVFVHNLVLSTMQLVMEWGRPISQLGEGEGVGVSRIRLYPALSVGETQSSLER